MPAILNALSYSLPQTSHLAILTTLSSHRFDHAIVFTYPQHRLYKRWRLLPPKEAWGPEPQEFRSYSFR